MCIAVFFDFVRKHTFATRFFSGDKESNISDIFPADRKVSPISGFSP